MTGLSSSAPDRTATLFIRGQVRLECGGARVKLPRKGLALLCYLALEGTERREILADLLWGHDSSAANLRVEVSRLRRIFSKLGFDVFGDREDPLRLPSFVELDRVSGKGNLLEGLEDISPQFQAWLDFQQSTFSSSALAPLRNDLVMDLVRHVTSSGLPFTVILKGPPGAGREHLAEQLAEGLRLPFIEGAGGPARALHLIPLHSLIRGEGVREALAASDGVWVFERSAFGEDPRALLELRQTLPAECIRFVELPPLSWTEARQRLLGPLPFQEAARIYLSSGGFPGYMRELLALRQEAGFGDFLPVPQRIRAAYQLEARYLQMEARFALERLSVHPGRLDGRFAEAMEASRYLDELERRGWLIYQGGWRFVDESARRVIYTSVPTGQRMRSHDIAAKHFAEADDRISKAYHLRQLGHPCDDEELLTQASPWLREYKKALREPPFMPAPLHSICISPDNELALLEEQVIGEGVDVNFNEVIFVRRGAAPPSGVEFALPEGASVIRIQGNCYVENALDIGLSGDAVPLELELIGRTCRRLVLGDMHGAHFLPDRGLLLPMRAEFEHLLYVEGFRAVRLLSSAELGVIEVQLTAYSTSPGRSETLAYDMTESSTMEIHASQRVVRG